MIVVINQTSWRRFAMPGSRTSSIPSTGGAPAPFPDSERLGILLDTVFRASMLAGNGTWSARASLGSRRRISRTTR